MKIRQKHITFIFWMGTLLFSALALLGFEKLQVYSFLSTIGTSTVAAALLMVVWSWQLPENRSEADIYSTVALK